MLQKMPWGRGILTLLVSSPSLNFLWKFNWPLNLHDIGRPQGLAHIKRSKIKKRHGHRVIALTWLVFVLFPFQEMGLTSFQGSTHLPCHYQSIYRRMQVMRTANPGKLRDVTTGFPSSYYLLVWAPGSLQKNSRKMMGISPFFCNKKIPETWN